MDRRRFYLFAIAMVACCALLYPTVTTVSSQWRGARELCQPCLPEVTTSSPVPASSSRQHPHHHVYYLKTHKTGSTTMYSILAELCRSHDLMPLMPVGHHINQAPPFRRSQVFLEGKTNNFDMVFNHHIFSKDILAQFLHNDTFIFTTLRDPYDEFVSSFHYFRDSGEFEYLNAVPGEVPILEFLKNPYKYEGKGYSSYTNNRQSMDLGYDINHSFDDSEYIKAFIETTERNFHLVMITEYFKESLVMLKRALHWTTQDILYLTKNKRSKVKNVKLAGANVTLYRQLHANFSQADIRLYNHFLPIFKARMAQERGLDEELFEYEEILDRVKAYCNDKNATKASLNIPAKRWTDPIYLLPYKCKWLRLDEVSFTKYLQGRQLSVLSP